MILRPAMAGRGASLTESERGVTKRFSLFVFVGLQPDAQILVFQQLVGFLLEISWPGRKNSPGDSGN
jgi:hypothetical protein